MGNECSSCFEAKPQYKVGKPLVSGKATPCFDDGRLFKVVKRDTWYFYNDTQDYLMKVMGNFGDGSTIVALGDTQLLRNSSTGAWSVTMTLLPLETKAMIKVKNMNGFKLMYSGIPFTEEDRQRLRRKATARVNAEIAEMRKLCTKHPKIKNQHQLLKAAWKGGKMYVDTSFLPITGSLIRPAVDSKPSGCLKSPEHIAWRRPEDFLPKEWHSKIQLFGNISPKDVEQGQLGDCYYLSSLAALAEYDTNIEGIFKNPHWWYVRRQEQKHGAWRVNINISGWWRNIIVDSYLPSLQLLPVFARNRRHPGELWVSLMEKAYAKAFGSYQAIEAGHPWHALEDLTGFPAFTIAEEWKNAQTDPSLRKSLFDRLHRWNKKKYLICVSTPSDGPAKMANKRLPAKQVKALFEKAGLQTGHAYTVLDVKNFPLHDLCLLKIRNPWGSKVEWTGDWSDDSPLWARYPLIRLACRPQKKADGIFWMEWCDVAMFFESSSICLRRGNWFQSWHDYRIPGNFENLECDTALEIIVKKSSNFSAYISLHQKDRRGLVPSDSDNEYAAIMMSITKGPIDGSRQQVVTNTSENPEEPSTEYLFQQSRSVSLSYEFEKHHRYFVIPRRMKSTTGNNVPRKKYVIALRMPLKASDNSVVVNIVRLERNSNAFKNVNLFDVGALTRLTTVYQTRHRNEVFRTYLGNNLCKGKKQPNAKYDLVM